MGNYKFRLSDMMPNAWFYKLRDMSITRNNTNSNSNSHPPTKKKPSSTKTNKPLPKKSTFLPTQPRQSHYYTSDSRARIGEFRDLNTNPKVPDLPFFPDPPRRSSKHRKSRRKTVYKPSPKRMTAASLVSDDDHHCTSCHHHASQALVRELFDSSTDGFVGDLDFLKSPSPEFDSDANESLNGLASRSSSCSCGFSSSATDIIFDVDSKSYTQKFEKLDGFDALLELELPPILTKPARFDDALQEAAKLRSPQKKSEASLSIRIVREESLVKTQKETASTRINSPGTRKPFSYSSGIKLSRVNSPKVAAGKKIQGSGCGGRRSVSRRSSKLSTQQKKGFSESFAIVKASLDPQKDFRDSMMEMIVENNIRASKDLEELLACYLSLNSNEYHKLIIKAFEQIWFNMPELNL